MWGQLPTLDLFDNKNVTRSIFTHYITKYRIFLIVNIIIDVYLTKYNTMPYDFFLKRCHSFLSGYKRQGVVPT